VRSDPTGIETAIPDMAKSTTTWWVYILRCADGSLYTGITTDAERRLRQHNAGTASKYTRSRRPVEMVYHQSLPNQSKALQREAAIKSLTRNAKVKLIDEQLQATRGKQRRRNARK
jgi:putative endonuclease